MPHFGKKKKNISISDKESIQQKNQKNELKVYYRRRLRKENNVGDG